MAAKAPSEARTFSVSVNKIIDGKNATNIIKNNIRRINTTSNWFELFDYATDSVTEDILPREAWDNFEKLASVSVSSSPVGEQFNVDPYEQIHVLADFDSSLKYVTISLKLTTDINNNNNNKSEQNAMAILMGSRSAKKMAKPLDVNKAKFTGK